jgi:hypothetical protein
VAGAVTDLDVAGFGNSGVLMAVRTGGNLKLIVWDGPGRGTAVDADRVSDHQGFGIGQPRVCAMPTSRAEGDFVTAGLEQSPAILRLRGWRVGDRP